jgi:hypothetical protein
LPQDFEEVEVTAPDGSVLIVEAPIGASDEQIFEFVRQNLGTPEPVAQPQNTRTPQVQITDAPQQQPAQGGFAFPQASGGARRTDPFTGRNLPMEAATPRDARTNFDRAFGSAPVGEQIARGAELGYSDTSLANTSVRQGGYGDLLRRLQETGADVSQYARVGMPAMGPVSSAQAEGSSTGGAYNYERIFRDAAFSGLIEGAPSAQEFYTQERQRVLEAIATDTPYDQFASNGTATDRNTYEYYRDLYKETGDLTYVQVQDFNDSEEARNAYVQNLQGFREAFDQGLFNNYGDYIKSLQEQSANDGIVPSITGQFIGSTPDPLNALGLEGGIVRAAASNAAVELGLSPVINQNRRERGQEEMTAGEMATNVAFAAGFGALLEAPSVIADRARARTNVQAAAEAPVAPTVTRPTTRRSNTQRGRYATQIAETVQQASDYVAHVTRDWTNAPDIEVRRNFNDLDGVDNDAIGVFNAETGRISVNMEGVIEEAARKKVSPEDVLSSVAYHEGLGHNGLQQLFADQLDDNLHTFYERGTQSFRRSVDNWLEQNPDSYAGDPNRIARGVDEVLAEMSEAGPLPRAMFDRLADTVKNFGRNMGLDISYSDREVRSILSMAHSAVVNGKGRDVVGNGFRYATVYHGSPYDFDRFDHSNMGRGEGNQAFGWGTYLTDTREVAEGYRDRTSQGRTTLPLDNQNIYRLDDGTDALTWVSEVLNRPENSKILENDYTDIQATMVSPRQVVEFDNLRDVYEAELSSRTAQELAGPELQSMARASEVVKEIQERLGSFMEKRGDGGKLYEVEVPDNTAWLEWDKPIAQQDPRVQEAIKQLGVPEQDTALTDLSGRTVKYPTTGADIYLRLERQLGSSKAVSQALDKLGVTGTKYLDGFSRGADGGTYNYVTFNDNTPKITNKYMKPRQEAELSKKDRRARQRTAADNTRNEIEAARRAGVDPSEVGLPNQYMRPSKEIPELDADDISDPGKLQAVLDAMSEGYTPTARTQEEAMDMARARGFTAKDVKKFSTEELDVRMYQTDQVLRQMQEKMTNLYGKMEDNGFGGKAKGDFLAASFKTKALLEQALGNSAEVGRALAIHRQLQFTRKKLANLNELLSQMQGNNISGFADEETFARYATQIQALLDSDNLAGAAAMTRKITKPYWWQYILSFRHAAMLSGIGTHAKNFHDSLYMIAKTVEEKALASVGEYALRRPARALGANIEKGVTLSELLAHGYGLTRALLDAQTWKNTWEAFKNGHGNRQYSARIEMQDARFSDLIGPVGKGIDFVNDALYASDMFFRAFHTNANLYALGVREAHKQGFTGRQAFEEGTSIAANATNEMIREADRLVDEVLLVDSPSGLTSGLEAFKAIRPGMSGGKQTVAFTANMLFPFLRVTDRLLFQAIRRSPFAFLDKNTREDFRAGGARRDIAISRAIMGTALTMYYWQAAEGSNEQEEGSVQGAGPMDYRKQQALEGGGFRENSVIADGKYTDATALNLSFLPWGTNNNVAASVATLRQRYEDGVADEGEVASGIMASSRAFAELLGSQTYAENLAPLLDLFAESRSEQEASNKWANFAGSTASQFIPAAVRQYNQQVNDPIKRATTGDGSFGDRVYGRVASAIPGLSEDLPARMSVYGDEMPQGRSTLGMSNSTEILTDDVAQELSAVERANTETIVDPAPSTFQFQNEDIRLDAEARQEWQAGRGYYLRQIMSEWVSSPEWRAMTIEEKTQVVQDAQKEANQYAREDMITYLGLEESEEN